MTNTAPGDWPPAPIRTARLVLRASEARDRPAFVDLFSSPEVNAYVGGPQPREKLEETMPEVPGQRAGSFVVECDGEMIGQILLGCEPGQIERAAGRAELGYLFLPKAWGQGYAAEACGAALGWFDATRPGEPVVLATQSANVSSMRLAKKLGFTEVARYESWGAEQWFGERTPVSSGQVRARRGGLTPPGLAWG
ncbi:N-acetyltransferase [Streptomyces finlayi]|uniref:N-acetyltransferase n=1 Tax=Streptomyces finlayi TaxID=67296 RepID=A0A918WWC4_9ACTN|nr:GNAT family N-acetyltransferase [Streptomyces finlayi]GHC89940.1 N-acetyltransferase [Streptomyces finlayi]